MSLIFTIINYPTGEVISNMPTYGYECQTCKKQIEVFQSIKDAPLAICESCGGALKKRIYPVGIAFKGSGFYVNDYAPKKSASECGSPAPTETKPETKSETATVEPAKTETKSEKKSDASVPAAA